MLSRLSALLLLLAALLTAAPVFAQSSATPAVDAAEARAMIATLEDPAKRAALIDQLRLLATAQGTEAESPSASRHLSDSVSAFVGALLDQAASRTAQALSALSDLPKVGNDLWQALIDPARQARWRDQVIDWALVVGAALVCGWMTTLLLTPWRIRVRREQDSTVLQKILRSIALMALYAVPVVTMLIAAFAALTLVEPVATARVAALAMINALVAWGMLQAVTVAVLMPDAGRHRALPIYDETANYLLIWIRRLSATAAAGYVLSITFIAMGMPLGLVHLVERAFGVVIALMLWALILQNRKAVQGVLAGTKRADTATVSPAGVAFLRRRLAGVWHLLAMVAVGGMLASWVFDVSGGIAFVLRGTLLTLLIFIVASIAANLTQRLLARGLALSEDMRQRFPHLERRANAYLGIINWVSGAFILVLSVLCGLAAWGVNSFAWLETGIGQRFSGAVVTILLVLTIAAVVWEVVANAVDRYLLGDHGQPRSARARTLLPLVRNVVMVLLVLLTSLVILSEIGIDIAPLLAGAGVIGLAIGFGSQALVRDVITGAFVLLEDQIAVGDVVSVGGYAGAVEGMSIRTLRLRDFSGHVHTIPFGEVTQVTNMTKHFSFFVFDLGVAYRENVELVIASIRAVGAELRQDPEHASSILEDIEVAGLDKFADSAVIIKGRIKVRAGKQWGVGRAFNQLIKKRFDEQGIEIPFPHTTLYFGADRNGAAPPAHIEMLASNTVQGPLPGGA
jgi:moderate conductance mechanosensitive channel